ncbi:uncharacterized protein LOC141700519 [Apium graveolens]|uniref:uncharacterized protein LOC141700519 n=1 Tax=Apium graveolens TaxID=4045 RepID=UPI003D79A8CC
METPPFLASRLHKTEPKLLLLPQDFLYAKWFRTLVLFNFSIFAYSREDCDKESDNFKRFVADAEQALFEGSECTKLESVLKLHNWKARFGVSDKAFTDLLQSIGSILPKDNLLPSNMYEAKKTLTDLGFEYIKFHACPNDCVLYRGPILESSSECPKCHLSRWKVGKYGQVRVNVPAKVMWYFPIIPRFKRMFKSSSIAELMSWHTNNRSKDGKMHHPSDSPSWRNVDCRWPEFGSEARNIRLGLATDGPQEPGNDIDVYLQPLIDDLKKLWEEDVMYIEKNVCDNIIGTLLHMKFKSKDSLASCLDLVDMGIRPNLAPESYVRNRFYPEGCIAEGYLKEESIEFCSEFYSGSSRTAGLPKDEEKISGPIGGVTMKSVAEKKRDEAHLSVLRNNSEVEPYVMLHKKYLEEIYQGKKKSTYSGYWESTIDNLPIGLNKKLVSTEMRENAEAVSETIRWLAGKPSFSVLTYESYAVEGVRYHTKDRDNARVVQNSGVSLVARTVQVSSANDMNPIETSDKGVKSDDLDFTLVNFNRPGHKKDKYVSIDQVNQVFYIEDPVDANWSVVFSATTRDYHDVYNEDAPEYTSWNPPPFCSNIPTCDPANIDDASVCNRRENVEGIWVKKL